MAGKRTLAVRFGRRFVRLSELASVDDKTVRLTSGEEIALAGRVQGLAQRIAQLKAHVADLASELDGTALERGGQPLAEWRQTLLGMLSLNSYRDRGWSLATLMAVAEDPTRVPEQRVAAAVAASASGDAQIKQRIEVAARVAVD